MQVAHDERDFSRYMTKRVCVHEVDAACPSGTLICMHETDIIACI